MTTPRPDIKFAFFGTPEFAAVILDELEAGGFLPRVIITAPDKPQGRRLVLTPPPVKTWAEARGIPVLQPASLKADGFMVELERHAPRQGWDVFIVAAYGKIIPQPILDMPRRKVLNVHPSLLPKFRGASPIESAILSENETGVTIMRLDSEMDHGPIVAQKKSASWKDDIPKATDLENLLAHEGGKVLAETLAPWVAGSIEEREQDHSQATYCRKIAKEDALIDMNGPAELNFRKIRAYAGWPNAYFFLEKNQTPIRIIIKDAELVDTTGGPGGTAGKELRITRIIPEGKKEMDYDDFMRNQK